MKNITLNGTWQMCDFSLSVGPNDLKRVKNSRRKWIPTPVPGDIRQGLIASALIKEPLIGINGTKDRWVEEKSWWLRKEFTLFSKDIKSSDEIEIELDGLDFNASIFINNTYLGNHNSAFYPFVKKIKKELHAGKNILYVRITAGLENIDQQAPYNIGGFIPTEDAKVGPQRIDPRRIFVRKPQFAWGWDWSPRVPGIGITGNTSLRFLQKSIIRDVDVEAVQKGKDVELKVTTTLEWLHAFEAGANQLSLQIYNPDGKLIHEVKEKCLLQTGFNYIDQSITIKKPLLWWPTGLGDQNLYTIHVKLKDGRKSLNSKKMKYGIRFVQLDTQDNFAIIINGKKVFCKGANWTPADTVYGRLKDRKTKELVRQAKLANYNMLRVWGGGLYERNSFYEACDKEGILLWHDFMFACSPYPDHIQSFCDEVAKEADYQTNRLKNHACIVLWCGNNECVQCQLLDPKNTTERGRIIWGEILPKAVRKNCHNIPYWYCSPYGAGKNYQCSNTTSTGNCHFWRPSMMHENINIRISPEVFDKCTAMFVSEFGYQGPCSIETTKKYLDGAPFDRNNDVWQYHCNTYEKNTIDTGIKKYYADPDKLTTEEYLFYGGLVQGLMYEYSIESLRASPACNGALFWMNHDSWGEIGWSVIDYYLKRKIAWHFVRRAFALRRIILRPVSNNIQIKITNDSTKTLSGILEYGYVSCDGTSNDILSQKVSVLTGNCLIAANFPRMGSSSSSGVWFARMKGHPDIAPGIFKAVPYRNMKMSDSKIKSQIIQLEKNRYKLKLYSNTYAHAVNLDLPIDALPDDNFFDLLPNQYRTIEIQSSKKITNQNIFIRKVES